MPTVFPDFDFNAWQQLAEKDPVGFVAARRQVIAQFIAEAPAEHVSVLKDLQNLIDASRAEAGSPEVALRCLMSMMGDHLGALRSQLVLLSEESDRLAEKLASIR